MNKIYSKETNQKIYIQQHIHIYKDIYIKNKNKIKINEKKSKWTNPEQVLVKVYLEQNCHIMNIKYIYYYIYIYIYIYK